MLEGPDRPFMIVQLSDLHCGQQFFLPNLLERAIAETNELRPDVVVISGDLTSHGFKDEYALAREYLNEIDCESMVVIPGTHDSRNVGYVHFEQLFGDRNSVARGGGVTVVAVDSTEPDLDHGQIVTGAGTAAGIDAVLHLVRRELGSTVATRSSRPRGSPRREASSAGRRSSTRTATGRSSPASRAAAPRMAGTRGSPRGRGSTRSTCSAPTAATRATSSTPSAGSSRTTTGSGSAS